MAIRPEFINGLAGLAHGPGDLSGLDGLAAGSLPAGALGLAAEALRLLVTLDPVLLALGPALLGWGALLQWSRDRRVGRAASAAGASPASARFAARALRKLPLREAVALFEVPELVSDVLAKRLRSSRSADEADELAVAARTLLDEIDGRVPAFEGAPLPFQKVCLGDGSDSHGIHHGYLCRVDERNISVIAHQRCPWPVRTMLIVSRPGGPDGPFPAWLLLRPMPGHHEWVLSHELCDDQNNRRAHARVPVEIKTWSLDATRQVAGVREKLRRGDRVPLGRLRRVDAWARRHRIRIRDLSEAGALLDMDHEVSPGDSFHLVIPADDALRDPVAEPEVAGRPDDDLRVAAMPLVEAVSVRLGTGGRLVVGTRFSGMRHAERQAMEALVHRAAVRHRAARRDAGRAAGDADA